MLLSPSSRSRVGFGENDQGALSFPHFIEFEKSMEERELSTCRHNLLTHFPRIANEKMLIHKVGRTVALWVAAWKKLRAKRREDRILILSLPINSSGP